MKRKEEIRSAWRIRAEMSRMPYGALERLRCKVPDRDPQRTAEQWLEAVADYLAELRDVLEEQARSHTQDREELRRFQVARSAIQFLIGGGE